MNEVMSNLTSITNKLILQNGKKFRGVQKEQQRAQINTVFIECPMLKYEWCSPGEPLQFHSAVTTGWPNSLL